jgi:DNA-binding response OmpR family regulator
MIVILKSSLRVKVGERLLSPTVTEFNLLFMLAKARGAFVPHQTLQTVIKCGSFQSLRCHMSRLRKKVGFDEVEARNGVGYRLTQQPRIVNI